MHLAVFGKSQSHIFARFRRAQFAVRGPGTITALRDRVANPCNVASGTTQGAGHGIHARYNIDDILDESRLGLCQIGVLHVDDYKSGAARLNCIDDVQPSATFEVTVHYETGEI